MSTKDSQGACYEEKFMAVLKDWIQSRNKVLYYFFVYFWGKKNKLWISTTAKKPQTQTLKNHSHLWGCGVRVKQSFLESNWVGDGIRRPTASEVPSAPSTSSYEKESSAFGWREANNKILWV